MGILEQIIQMKNQGIGEEEIIGSLQEQGVSPDEINNALNQAQIKTAVSDFYQESEAPTPERGYSQQAQETGQGGGYQAQEYYPQPGYGTSQGMDSDMMVEISEQVFSEKVKTIEKKLEEMNEFRVLTETKLNTAVERLKKIEETIDRLQIAILEKVGSYGTNLETIRKEMSMMQDSFGKVMKSSGRTTTAPKQIKRVHKR